MSRARYPDGELTASHIAPAAKALAWQTSNFIPDREAVARSLRHVPARLHLAAVSTWALRHKAEGNHVANAELRDIASAFEDSHLPLAATDDEIVALAKYRARH